MSQREYVVNVIAHVNHGKTTFMDNVLEYAGVLTKSAAGEARFLDTRKDELERGMTMKLSPFSVEFQNRRITFLDTPGHLEFNSLTLSTFIISDVSVVVVDVMKGVTERLKGLIKKAEESSAKILLFINKIDALFKLGIPQDEIEYRIEKVLQDAGACAKEAIGWSRGNVVAGSAKENWLVSKNTDTSRVIRREKTTETSEKNQLSLKKAVILAQKVYRLSAKETETLAQRVGMKTPEMLKAAYAPKDVLAHEFGFFKTFAQILLNMETEENFYSQATDSVPEEVLGVVCANTVAGGAVTSIVRTLHGKSLGCGEKVFFHEQGGAAQHESTVEKIVLFSDRAEDPARAAGLIGVQGIDCKKRGVIASAPTENAKRFSESLRWFEFTPIFTDVVLPAPEDFPEAVKRVSTLSKCEPGIFCSVTKENEIIVRSDGELQLDKIKTDLGELRYVTKEKSGEYMETVAEKAAGRVHAKDKDAYFQVSFEHLADPAENNGKDEDSAERADLQRTHARLFGREVYLLCDESVPAEVKREVCSLLQCGPFLHAPCDKIIAEIRKCGLDGPTHLNIERERGVLSVSEIYQKASPRILVNQTELTLVVPNAYVKSVSVAMSKASAVVISTEHGEDHILFQVKAPVQEIRRMATLLRVLAKGECDILPSKRVFFEPPEDREYEKMLCSKIREEKGIQKKDKIL